MEKGCKFLADIDLARFNEWLHTGGASDMIACEGGSARDGVVESEDGTGMEGDAKGKLLGEAELAPVFFLQASLQGE